ncbi:MAG TPA: stage II sporulation protein M [Bryobacteraceae bacterium]|nr:stage II sporulation protein M [Bryobacteraceae bacterium]
MIIDLERFVSEERKYWEALEKMLADRERDPERRWPLKQVLMLHELYQRCSADLAKVATFSGEPDLRRYLETIVARAYSEIHAAQDKGRRWALWRWFTQTFPQTFRRRIAAFWLSCAVTIGGVVFGAAVLKFDPDAKRSIMPFAGLLEDPADRVKREEAAKNDRLSGVKGTFAAELMTHNTQVTFFTMALGITWGVGTLVTLFYNGVILGAVGFDYIHAGQWQFLFGWILPHGAVEIPAILLGGQAGFLLASALIGWGSRQTRRDRLRSVAPDLVTIIFGAALMLVWAGIVEAFLSQYHQPVVPYVVKMTFGLVEMAALTAFFSFGGRKTA